MTGKKNAIPYLVLVLKGVVVGFGAIMPGISGGTLCVAFGMYRPLLNVFSNPVKTLREDGWKLFAFVLGAGLGFVGLSGLAGWLMEKNSQLITCVFIGFILGTIPELWKDAGEQGRKRSSYISMGAGFFILLGVLLLLRSNGGVAITPGIGGFLFCGVMWGISFIVPGLSSSTLLIFFGLYQPMLEGISRLSMPVLLPLAAGVGLCLLLLPRAVNALYRRWYSQISHAIIGVVLASTVSVIPADLFRSLSGAWTGIIAVIAGCAVSYAAGRACARLGQDEKS